MAKVIQKGRAVNSNSSETILYYKAKNDITLGGVVFFVSKKTIKLCQFRCVIRLAFPVSAELRNAAFVYAMTR